MVSMLGGSKGGGWLKWWLLSAWWLASEVACGSVVVAFDAVTHR